MILTLNFYIYIHFRTVFIILFLSGIFNLIEISHRMMDRLLRLR